MTTSTLERKQTRSQNSKRQTSVHRSHNTLQPSRPKLEAARRQRKSDSKQQPTNRTPSAPTPAPEPMDDGISFGLPLLFVVFSAITGLASAIVFGLDLAIGWPFSAFSPFMDVSYVLCGFGLMYLSWHTYREI